MNIETDRTKVIFKRINDKGTFYSIGLSRKDKDGNYIHGYMSCRFPKEATLEDKTRIMIHEAWIDFYIKDKITYPYIFINKYEVIEDEKLNVPDNKSNYDNEESDVQVRDEDLPF